MPSTDTENMPEKAGKAKRRRLRLYNLGRGVLSVWFLALVILGLLALVRHWLEVPQQIVAVHQEEELSGDKGSDVEEPEQPITPPVNPLRVRTVEEMLNEGSDEDGFGAAPLVPMPSFNDVDDDEGDRFQVENLPEQNEIDLSDELRELLKEARYAQIEGDMRRAVIKLSQASEIAPDNPIVCYYYGLSYEFLRNAAKSREYFAKVVAQPEAAGKFYELAAIHLERGFSSPADRRGDMSFGTILQYHEPNVGEGERVILTIPVLMKDGLNIRPEDLRIVIHFFDAVNGNKSIDLTRAEEPVIRWISEPVDWEDGEEILEAQYYMPPLTQEELVAYGDLKYYGYTAKLYYKGEPMDCHASPPVLFLIEQMKQNRGFGIPGYEMESLLPPLEAIPASDDDSYYFGSDDDSGLLPP